MKLIQTLLNLYRENKSINSFTPEYRVLSIEKDDADTFYAHIQIINKNVTYKMTPEEILSNDSLVDKFSPRDIRTLTYVGSLYIHSPKYKILAQRLSQTNGGTEFSIRKKGDKKIINKTADQLQNNKDIIENMTAFDANIVGYTTALESFYNDDLKKSELTAH